jgi:hypothetical protein
VIAKELKRKHNNWPLLGRVWLCNAYLTTVGRIVYSICVFTCMVCLGVTFYSLRFPISFLSVNTEADIGRVCKQVELHLKANYFGFDVFMNTANIYELLCLIFPSPYRPTSSYVRSYISFVDPDFAALLPKDGTTGWVKIMFCIRFTDSSVY